MEKVMFSSINAVFLYTVCVSLLQSVVVTFTTFILAFPHAALEREERARQGIGSFCQ